MNTENNDENQIQFCSLCWLNFPDVETLRAHIITLHDYFGSRKYFCHICPQRFSQLRYLYNHLNRHFKNPEIEEPENKPRMVVHEEKDQPDFLENFIIEEKSVENKISTKEEPIKNPQKSISREMWWENDGPKRVAIIPNLPPAAFLKSYTCKKCQKVFFDLYKAGRHNTACFTQPSILCNYCGILQRSKEDLRWHLRRKHKIYIHKCQKCTMEFLEINNLISHMKTDHDFDHSLMCEDCGKVYPKKKALTRHQKTHAKKIYKVYICKVCKKEFSNLNSHRVHAKTHLLKSDLQN